VKVGEVLKEYTSSSGKIAPSCLLPGVKRKSRENYQSALSRLLERDLGEISSQVQIRFQEGCEQTVLVQPSHTLGIRTRYLRTTFQAVLSDGDKLFTVPAPTSAPKLRRRRSFSMFSADGRARLTTQEKAAAVLADQTSVTVLHCGDGNSASRKLYLWLTADEFEVLSQQMAKPVIQQWVTAAEEHLCTMSHEIPVKEQELEPMREEELTPVTEEEVSAETIVDKDSSSDFKLKSSSTVMPI